MERKGLALLMDVTKETMNSKIFSDPRRIEQVMLNLISNAMKFTFEGFISISVVLMENIVRFEVRDSGVGISEESLPNLFKLFGKLKEKYDINKTGCGIGLNISQQIVCQLGGQI